MTSISPRDDTLVSVSSSAARIAQVHQVTMEGNVMRMRETEGGPALPAGTPVTLRPNGYHGTLTDLKAPLKQGQTMTPHPTLANAPLLDVSLPIKAIGSTCPPA